MMTCRRFIRTSPDTNSEYHISETIGWFSFIKYATVFLLLLMPITLCAQSADVSDDCVAVDHTAWSELLQQHVDAAGLVSYKGFQSDSVKLNAYLFELSRCPPAKTWSTEEQLAYWINAYNAFTVKLILDHYPLESIKDIKRGIPFINSVWDIDFFEIGGQKMDLNEIEHAILRKQFNEPRIHFAIVCASKSCPRLLNTAYTAEKLEAQLQAQAVEFINDPFKNRVQEKHLQLSPIFRWFKGDFTNGMTIQEYVLKYSKFRFDKDADVSYMDYDWSLNGN